MTTLLILLAVYLTVVAAAYLLQRRLLYFPAAALPTPAQAGVPEMRRVTYLTEDRLTLTAWYAAPPAGAPVLLLFHGNAGNLADRAFKARSLLDAGIGVLLAGYRGYGGNPGRPAEAGFYADARAALSFLAAERQAPARCILYGESLGSGIATRLAAEQAALGEPVGAVILEAPYTSIPAVAQSHYWYLPAYWLLRDRFENRASIDRIGAPLLILHGAKDTTIPVRMGRALFAAAREPKEALWPPAAGHNDVFDHAATDLVEFIQTRFGTTGPRPDGE